MFVRDSDLFGEFDTNDSLKEIEISSVSFIIGFAVFIGDNEFEDFTCWELEVGFELFISGFIIISSIWFVLW